MNIIEELKNSYSNQFQDLFTNLMKLKYGNNYQSTMSNGKIGDLKVDGVLNFNIAFAVYGPEIFIENKVINKLKSDFLGFIKIKNKGKNWQNIIKYIFVIKTRWIGITSKIIDLISNFNNAFPVEVLTMDDLENLYSNYLPFSKDGVLFNEFKSDTVKILEYILRINFTAEPFYLEIFDEIEILKEKWLSKTKLFSDENLENIKFSIFNNLTNLWNTLIEHGFHLLSDNERCLIDNNTEEKGYNLRSGIFPNKVYEIQNNIKYLFNKLWEIR
ncbi:hypothetical protein KST17_07365 [Fusobacterium canifelinum]|uniref:hypothetical protein n=1 Tax=Fusobacterium canifelinum TaxID=285729 RepID=UPI0030D23077